MQRTPGLLVSIMRAPKHLSILLCVLSLVASAVADDDDEANETWWERVDIPLTFDSGGRYVVGVAMSTTPHFQNFSFTLTTGTGMTYVAASGGNFAQNVPLYNQTASPSAQLVASSAKVNLFGQATNTTAIKETCALKGTAGGLWQYENQTLFLLHQVQPNVLEQATGTQLGEGITGIAGLGTNRGPSSGLGESSSQTPPGGFPVTFEDSIVGQWFNRIDDANNFTFGMALNPPIITPKNTNESANGGNPSSMLGTAAGVMHLNEPDSAYYDTTSVKWVNATVPKDNSSLPPSDWLVILDGWQFSSQNNRLSSNGQIVVDIDPIYTGIYVPHGQAALIHAAIAGSSLTQGLSTLGSLSEAWTIPCDSTFTFGLVLDGQNFVLDHNNLVIKESDGTCVSAIEGWTDTDETRYLLGSRFMSTVYLIFSVPRDGTSIIGIAYRTNGSSSNENIGAIVGGTIGGVALVIFTAFGVFYVLRLRRQAQQPPPHVPSFSSAVEPKPPVSPGFQSLQSVSYNTARPVSAQYAAIPQHSPASSQHFLTPTTSPHSMVYGDRNSVPISPPSYQQTHPYSAPPTSGEKVFLMPPGAPSV